MKSQSEYWEHFIIDWDRSVYEKNVNNLSMIEKFASQFRDKLVIRHQFAVDFLRPLVAGRKILEIGCGTGRLSKEMVETGAHLVTGIDISRSAINSANSVLSNQFPSDRFRFIAGELEDIDFSELEFDTVIGLGILQYLTEKNMRTLFKNFGDASLFFEFHEKSPTLVNGLHWFYRNIKKTLYRDYPYLRAIPRKEIRNLVDGASYYHIPGASFFTTFPAKGWVPI